MQGDPLPGEALHVRHRRILADARIVFLALLQDSKKFLAHGSR